MSCAAVVHDTPNAASGSGAKMLCADLSPEDLSEDATYSGALSYLSSYGGPGFGEISGDVRLGKANTLQTSISFADSDFGDLVFGAHLHSDTCANNGGGVRLPPASLPSPLQSTSPIFVLIRGPCFPAIVPRLTTSVLNCRSTTTEAMGSR